MRDSLLWAEDYAVGQIHRTRSRTIFESEILGYVALGWNRSEVHTVQQPDFGAGFSGIIAPSMFGTSIALGLLYWDVGYGQNEASCVSWSNLRFRKPLQSQDTVCAELEIVGIDAVVSTDGSAHSRILARIVLRDVSREVLLEGIRESVVPSRHLQGAAGTFVPSVELVYEPKMFQTPERLIASSHVVTYNDLTWAGPRPSSAGDTMIPSELLLGSVFGLEGWNKAARQGIVALLEVKRVRFGTPVTANSNLSVETEMLNRRGSQSRPGFDVVTLSTTGVVDSKVAVEVERVALYRRED